VSDFDFLVVTNQSGLNGSNGILGLSPANESQNGPSYIKALYNQKIIDSEEITFWLNYSGTADSSVTLGGVPADSTIGETWSQSLVNRYD